MGEQTILYIFSGLPGTGKSELSQSVAREIGAAYLRIDTIEQGLRDLCATDVQAEGYRLAYRIAADNLRMGLSVVADSCNPIKLTRREWEQVARDVNADFVNIEVICSDAGEHRQRVERRVADIPGLKLPSWAEVENREYHEWTADRIVIDTAGKTQAQCERELISALRQARN
jgi:predicted kinase